MRALWDAGIQPDALHECVKFYTLAAVELAYLDGELGVFDNDRIDDIAALFDVDRTEPDFLWFVAATELEAGHGSRHRAAAKALAAGKLAIIAHRPLFDMADASKAFLKTPERDEALFGRKLIRPNRIDPKTGGYAKTKRIFTGMPTVEIEGITFRRVVPDGPGTDRFTTAERKALAAELDVKTETVRKNEREKTPEAFEVWANRLRKGAATKAKKEAEKLARANRRKRKPGKTAAVRRFIEYAEHMGGRRYSERHAYRILKGLSTAQILARCPVPEMIYIGGSEGPATTSDVSNKEASYPAFLVPTAISETRDETPPCCHDVSDNVSNTDPRYPAFFHSLNPNPVDQDATSDDQIAVPIAPPVTVPTSEFQDTLDAWAKLRTIPSRGIDIQGLAQAAEWHAYIERNRASTVYGRQPLPTPEDHAVTMEALHAGAASASAEFGAVAGF